MTIGEIHAALHIVPHGKIVIAPVLRAVWKTADLGDPSAVVRSLVPAGIKIIRPHGLLVVHDFGRRISHCDQLVGDHIAGRIVGGSQVCAECVTEGISASARTVLIGGTTEEARRIFHPKKSYDGTLGNRM